MDEGRREQQGAEIFVCSYSALTSTLVGLQSELGGVGLSLSCETSWRGFCMSLISYYILKCILFWR
jgi:hypothetical protein